MDVLIVRPDTEVPDEGTCYLVTKQGMMMQLDLDWITARIPIDAAQMLAKVETGADLKLPPIDALVFAKAVKFFREVYERHGTEAAVLLHYSPELGWEISCPKQEVAYATVKYDMRERIEGYRCVGTMHSHGNMGAHHSGTDTRDEGDFDGVHITIGGLGNKSSFEMDAEFTFRGHRFTLNHENIEGVEKWGSQQSEVTPSLTRFVPRMGNKRFVTDMAVLGDWVTPQEWWDQVTVRRYWGYTPGGYTGTRPVRRPESEVPKQGLPVGEQAEELLLTEEQEVHEPGGRYSDKPDLLDHFIEWVRKLLAERKLKKQLKAEAAAGQAAAEVHETDGAPEQDESSSDVAHAAPDAEVVAEQTEEKTS